LSDVASREEPGEIARIVSLWDGLNESRAFGFDGDPVMRNIATIRM